MLAGWCAGTTPAQGMGGVGLDGQRGMSQAEARTELSRLENRRAATFAERDRLMVLMAHAALGWDVGDATALLVERVLDSTEQARERQRLAELERELLSLRGHHARLRDRADRELGPAALPDEAIAGDPGAVGVGEGRGGRPGGTPAQSQSWQTQPSAEAFPDRAGTIPAAPGGAGPSRRTAESDGTGAGEAEPGAQDAADEGGVFGLVKGSTDHGAVGRLLFLAGRSLHKQGDQEAAQGRAEAAAELRARARRKYEQGVRELRQVLLPPPENGEDGDRSGEYLAAASYPDLFHEARCMLGLFDLDVAEGIVGLGVDVRVYEQRMEAIRRPLLVITSRDVRTVDGVEKFGTWGQSAEAMLDQLRWRMTQDGYQPAVPDISWREKERAR